MRMATWLGEVMLCCSGQRALKSTVLYTHVTQDKTKEPFGTFSKQMPKDAYTRTLHIKSPAKEEASSGVCWSLPKLARFDGEGRPLG